MTKQQVANVFEGSDVVSIVTATDGRDFVEEFLEALEPRERAKIYAYFEWLRDGHRIKSPENMRHIKDVHDPTGCGAQVHELKLHQNGGRRLYVVKFENRWYATHGVLRKPPDKKVRTEALKAFSIFNDVSIDETDEEE
ncbi:type II toxin-antitoxin system RelE/ParE family toxin [Pseudoclavibacter sp. AY1H1]|uniref:type II toxin-antitoxin system RelE/ParE family toxin n=1 Tax=Pseudoclavibacter sp. AY1H1 TaxID=2080584 RepID=UPI000CE8E1AC|nr:type II toxin-antitoxin system RelE/ParE family toxin [Pseudoclavibacter sp. AY1H1]PPF39991.1 hypothetical protein C5E05_01900 [Pseudoclavibacter sp. AY1H1]